jgi:3-phosphoshikimate 1-carboxyvinyltransferase
MDMVLEGRAKLRGTVHVPGDKSISHRAVILSSISSGKCRIRDLSSGRDVQATLDAFKKMGVTIVQEKDSIAVGGLGIAGFEALLGDATHRIDCKNSGTTARLLIGIFAGSGKKAVLTGDLSLQKRPMMRVVGPLADHGAVIHTREGVLPVELDGGKLLPIHYSVPVPSAQVKSALILAALFIEGQSVINEPVGTRDHTERMLLALDAKIRLKDTQHGREIYISGRSELSPIDHTIPGDISSAVFFIAAALVLPSSELILRNVLINPTRAYILEVLRRMGGRIEVEPVEEFPEPTGNIHVRSSKLEGIRVGRREVPLIIDEIPALAACGFFAKGITSVSGAEELRIKESDRVKGIVEMVRAFGGSIEETDDGFVLEGGAGKFPADIQSFGDHRLAMAASIIALGSRGKTVIRDAGCVSVSFPGFFRELNRCTVG